jgi:hypothetical protein
LAAHRQIDTEEGEEFADQHNLIFKETSAKDNINITELFNEIGLYSTTIQFSLLFFDLYFLF